MRHLKTYEGLFDFLKKETDDDRLGKILLNMNIVPESVILSEELYGSKTYTAPIPDETSIDFIKARRVPIGKRSNPRPDKIYVSDTQVKCSDNLAERIFNKLEKLYSDEKNAERIRLLKSKLM